jgi:hypothetical protein
VINRCDGQPGAYNCVGLTSSPAIGTAIIAPDGHCYTVEVDNLCLSVQFTDPTTYASCELCGAANPTPTPTATPVPTPTPTAICTAINVGQQSTTTGTITNACYPSKSITRYFNATSVCAATKMYDDFTCTTLAPGTVYVSEVGVSEYRIWNGTNFTTACTACPPPP